MQEILADRYKLIRKEYQDPLRTVYEAFDQRENIPVTVEVLDDEISRGSRGRLLRFRKDVEAIAGLVHPNLTRIHAFGESAGRDYLVLERVEGAGSLAEYLQEPFDGDTAVGIMLQAGSGLAAAHNKGVLHHALHPSHILISQIGDAPLVKLSGFGLGLLQDLAAVKEENEVVATFGCMSPEGSGILRKPVDERSDLYSLGIIFYQLVTGRLPYDGRDMSTLVHQHVAQKPALPRELNPAVSPVVERMILRLIAKDPLDRYQTVPGLIADLEEYRRQRAGGKEVPEFEIGRSDRAGALSFVTRLIGRKKELELLLGLVARSKTSHGHVCLVHGEVGIGKTRLLEELRNAILGTGVMFAAGKGYKSEVATPYKAIAEIIEAYLERLRRLSVEDCHALVKRMQGSLGELGGEIVKLAPDIVEFIGEPPELVALDAEKERVRFLMTVTNFILGLGTPASPLVIAVDDVQWADSGSLELLGRIAEQAGSHPLLLVTSFADTDTPEDHPFRQAMEGVRGKGGPVEDILLNPFTIEETTRCVAEILLEEQDEVLPLAGELQERTRGNVYFVLELLRSIVEKGIIRFEENHYRYDLAQLRQASLPTDIVEVVVKRVKEVSADIQRPLSYAAVMGQRIDLELLSQFLGIPESAVLSVLEAGIKNQFLGRDNDEVFYVHDRIRNAFSKRLSEEERISLHARLAHHIEESRRDDLEPYLYELAHHYAQARIEDKTLYYSIEAGKKAQAAFANDQAIQFYIQAKTILEQQGTTAGDEYVNLLENLGSVYKTSGKFDEAMDALTACDRLIPKKDVFRRAEVLSKAGDTLWEKGEGGRAAELLREALQSLGVRLPVTLFGVLLGLLKESFIQVLHTLFPGLFVRKEYRHDQKQAVIVRIVIRIAYFYYFTDIIRCLHLGMKFVNMGERMGPSRVLSNIYSGHTVIWSGFPVAFRAKRDGNLAVKIARDLHDKAAEGSAYGYFATSTYCNRDVEEAYAYALKNIELLKGIGEYWDLGLGFNFRDLAGMLLGKNLNEMVGYAEEAITTARNTNSTQMLGFGLYGKAYALALIGDAERIRTEGIKAAQESIEVLGKAQDKPNGLLARSFLALAYDRAGMYDEAIQMAEEVARLFPKNNNMGGWIHTLFPIGAQVYLDCIRCKPGLTEEEKQKYLKGAQRFCRKAFWRRTLFPYIRSHTDQARGACQWLAGNKKKAVEIWDGAIEHIRSHTKDTYRLASILLEEASFLLQDNPADEKARGYLLEAKDIFAQVGAVHDLKRTDELLGIEAGEEAVDARRTLTLTRQLDALLSVTRAIGSVFVLEELLDKVVHQAMQVTGAERGFLLLHDPEDGTLRQKVSIGLDEAETADGKFSFANCKISLNLIKQVEKGGEGLFEGCDGAEFPDIASDLKEYGVKEALCVPLKAKAKPLGMIYLDNRMASGIFGKDELEIMNSFAVQASISIENAYLVGKMVEQERLKKELELARKIQTSLLPVKPGMPGYSVAGIMSTADEVGGDYYDVINIGDLSWLVIGDVSGHGLPSGLVMMMVQTAVNVSLQQQADVRPQDLLSTVNKTITQNLRQLGENKYMTITVLAANDRGNFTFAGLHQDMLIYRAKTKEVERVRTNGMWLGIMEDISSMVIDDQMRLEEGDTLLLYTDGVTEAFRREATEEERRKGEDMYGDHRLVNALCNLGGKPVREIQTGILRELEEYHCPDDVTMLVVRRTGSQAGDASRPILN